jgi:hypothetical protein
MVPQAELKVYKGAPHGLFFTDKDRTDDRSVDLRVR